MRRTRFKQGIAALVGIIGVGLLIFVTRTGEDSERLLADARRRLAQGQHAEAEQLATSAANYPNASPWTWLVAAEAAVRQELPAKALAYYENVPPDAGEASAAAGFGAAEMLCHLGRLSESESRLRQVLQLDPLHTLSHQRLAFILNITGRRWEANRHLLHVVQQFSGDVEPLLLLGSSERILDATELLTLCRQTDPDDPLPLLGESRRLIALNRTAEARELLDQIGDRLSDESELWVRRGQLLAETSNESRFLQWYRDVPDDVAAHPEFWLVQGTFALTRQQRSVAARCFWETLLRDPEHRSAHYKLGQVLTEMGEPAMAAPLLERAERMLQLALVLDDLFHHPDQVPLMERAAVLNEGLGRLPEAYGWSMAARRLAPGTAWARNTVQRLLPLRPKHLKQTLIETNLARSIDLSRYPLPDWPISDPSASSSANAIDQPDSLVHFVDDASHVGINFEYFNSADATTPGARIFETTGGGTGVLDYDADGWPDLYLTQGCVYPKTDDSPTHMDQLFRNLRGQTFQTATESAGIDELDFSQGVAAGDLNGDGFQDLYVANLGQNRLWMNNGDGTLTDVTPSSLPGESRWTTSCLIADLNGDGAPELFDVNYAMGSKLESLICERQGKWRACSPRAFDAAPDHLWLNLSDGQFAEVSDTAGMNVPDGFGLGIIAADLSGNGQLSLFVANDEVPNFLFVNQSVQGSVPLFTEQALVAGVAVDGDGASQGCMGIAADDADGDGLLDLFVTNFFHESNTLYRQMGTGQFSDETRRSGLRNPGFAMLGFGTQFLDADLDGRPDLVVSNGHVDDLTDLGEPWQMAPQFFHNTGGGVFQELPASRLGPFFAGKYLGRGLARIDWNADGLDDFAVSHIGSPAALLTNQSEIHGHFLTVRLRGTQVSRDAIGTIVEVNLGSRRVTKQLTAGDGYHASNERQLTFGLDTALHIDSVVVHWPQGQSQTWDNVIPDQRVLLVEGHTQMYQLAD